MDKKKIMKAVTMILEAVGENPKRKGLQETPRRVAEMYEEIFAGIKQDPSKELEVVLDQKHEEIILLKNIPLYSVCEHHLLPFYGVVHLGYIPNTEGRVVGISKLARVVECISRRPQIQERMATQIADAVNDGLKPDGVAVVIQAEHLCMVMRGIKKPGSTVITSALRGVFQKRAAARAEFFSLIQGK